MTYATLEQAIEQRYGVGVVAASPETVLWAVEFLEDSSTARNQLARVNALRQKHGKIPAYAPYGSTAF